MSTATREATGPAGQPTRPSGKGGWGLSGSSPLALAAKVVLLGMVAAITVWMAMPLIATQSWVLLALLLLSALAIFVVYLQPRYIPPKYLVPGVIFLLLFQVFPVLFTVSTAFTNFGDGHRGSKEEAITAIESSSVKRVKDSATYSLSIATKGDPATGDLVFLLTDPKSKEALIGDATGIKPLEGAEVSSLGRVTAAEGYTILNAGQASTRSKDISNLSVPTDTGAIRAQGISRAYEGVKARAYDKACDCIKDTTTGATWKADGDRGSFVNDKGEALSQGWRVNVGAGNFTRVFQDKTLQTHFLSMLAWNFFFALAVVFGTFAVGLAIALALHHPRLKGLKIYRILIVLPYAMPAFAMMLVWRDMFNQDFGLINQLTGASTNWFGNPWLAKLAVIIIQFWLGYPYMFLVTTGALQSIPTDLTEAAGVDGASKFFSFRTITLPLLFVATAPLLISSFAFNFNNFNAIGFTTEGGPFPPESPQVGGTDLLISYTYRLAFGAGGAQYGFAAAMSLLIFLIVAIISIISFRRTAALEEIN
ncbi:MAG: ABC transporter permease subunit [Micrococcales bacterium]|nr:ABC transporter permease subunit [Micrococcales bacterium]